MTLGTFAGTAPMNPLGTADAPYMYTFEASELPV